MRLSSSPTGNAVPTEHLPAIGQDGNAYIVVRKTPNFAAISRTSSRFDMATYRLSTGEELSPTGEPNTFRTMDAKLVLTLVGAV
jgi:hypothetical protein